MFYVDADVVCSKDEAVKIIREDKIYGDLVNVDVIDKVNGNLVLRLSSLFDTAVLNACKRLGFQDALSFLMKENEDEDETND